jgi:hypothetical protein
MFIFNASKITTKKKDFDLFRRKGQRALNY